MPSKLGSSTEATKVIAKVFRELKVYGEPEALDGVIAGIEKRLADGWSRDRESEENLPGDGTQSRFFLFARCAGAEGPAIRLAMRAEGRQLSVTNVMPAEVGFLSCTQYNSALVEFFLRFLHPAASEAGLRIELSPDERSFESEYGSQAVKLLRRFSVLANKSSRHSADERRWMDFLIHVHHHRPHRDYGFALLAQWLIDDGWSEDKTRELISECEFALDLLSVYGAALGLSE